MSAHLDLHILASLQKFWPVILADAALWDACHIGIDSAEAEKTRTKLVAQPLVFRDRLAKGKDAFPVVVVQLDSESRYKEALGNRKLIEVQQTAILDIYGQTVDTTRSIHVVTRAILQECQKRFLEAGYDDFRYSGVSSLSDVQELAAEQLGVYQRRVRYEAKVALEIPDLLPVTAEKPWMVLAEDITDDDGHVGKVKLGL